MAPFFFRICISRKGYAVYSCKFADWFLFTFMLERWLCQKKIIIVAIVLSDPILSKESWTTNFWILFRLLCGTVQLPVNRKIAKYRMLLATWVPPTDETVIFFYKKLDWPVKIFKHSTGFNLDLFVFIHVKKVKNILKRHFFKNSLKNYKFNYKCTSFRIKFHFGCQISCLFTNFAGKAPCFWLPR
jgi:hypothetical protein